MRLPYEKTHEIYKSKQSKTQQCHKRTATSVDKTL